MKYWRFAAPAAAQRACVPAGRRDAKGNCALRSVMCITAAGVWDAAYERGKGTAEIMLGLRGEGTTPAAAAGIVTAPARRPIGYPPAAIAS
jgi:hypothetical protein